MAKRKAKTENQLIEQYRIGLENVISNEYIHKQMNDHGYSDALISEGKALFDHVKKCFFSNHQKHSNVFSAKIDFDEARSVLNKRYRLDRKKAKVVFPKDSLAYKQLGLPGLIPNAHLKWIDLINGFYQTLSTNTALLDKMGQLKFSITDVQAGISDVQMVEEKRSTYYQCVAEAEASTKYKNEEFKRLKLWMQDYYNVARIALYDHPQYLESLGLFVRS